MDANTTLFSVIGVAALAAMIIGMLVTQSRHKALEARNNQIRLLTLQQKRLNNLLRTLPSSYLSVELRDFLYQAMLQNLKTHIDLVPDKNDLLKEDYQQLMQERENARANPPKPSKDMLTADQASIYRGLLKSLYEFIKRNYETGRMKKEHAEKLLKQVQIKLIETAVDYFTLIADENRRQDNFRQTRNAYQKALDTIAESPYESQFRQETVNIRSKLNQVVEDWRQSRESLSKAASEKLAGEMESLVDDQESWKKKQTYE
ncbi:hypothetical protein [Reinekea blandensis]|uniref:Uncharacterized protein n=1 Tax=Reinekea blandensis MED297 TaxID=314283 RepID=A4BH56_9GAMM|nr:hypothetical protein [Reinekea blandensis]EAR08555.1 hypothetical protein MED297_15075 [Reinekea sp. MED297] [Reinekea blandensis MED297]